MTAQEALTRREIENNVAGDDLYINEPDNELIQNEPWSKDPMYFKYVKMSASALIKLMILTETGSPLSNWREGILIGHIREHTFVITDVMAWELPWQAHPKPEIAENTPSSTIGWFVSHPDIGVYLGRIECEQHKELVQPNVVLIVDPIKSANSGRVELAAFNTMPPQKNDYGYIDHYQLQVSVFKSSLDAVLLNDLYWINTLSTPSQLNDSNNNTNRLLEDVAYKSDDVLELDDLSQKFNVTNTTDSHTMDENHRWPAFRKVIKISEKLSADVLSGLMSMEIKKQLFS